MQWAGAIALICTQKEVFTKAELSREMGEPLVGEPEIRCSGAQTMMSFTGGALSLNLVHLTGSIRAMLCGSSARAAQSDGGGHTLGRQGTFSGRYP